MVKKTKEKAQPIHSATPDERELLDKIILPSGELDIPVGSDNERNEKRAKVWWSKTGVGFDTKPFAKALFKKKLNEAIKNDLIGTHYTEVTIPKDKVFKISKEQGYVLLALYGIPISIVEGSLEVHIESALKQVNVDYIYNPDLGALFFVKEQPQNDILVKCKYYDEEMYNELLDVSLATIIIYFSARKLDNHSERYFNTMDEISNLTEMQVREITSLYIQHFEVGVNDLKKSSPSPSSDV